MAKIKEIDMSEDLEGFDDPEEEIEDDLPEDDLPEVNGNIFDEDLNSSVSNFDIGSTMLTAAPVESWAGQNLEETLSREHIEKDWGDEEELVTGDIYRESSESTDPYVTGDGVYGATGNSVYGASNDVYGATGESGSSGAYVTDSPSAGYSAGGGKKMKSYDQMKDDRRGARSMLEVAGFEDKDKKRQRELRTDFRSLKDDKG